MRKFDWMTLAIAAPDDFVSERCLAAHRHGTDYLSWIARHALLPDAGLYDALGP